MVLINFVIMNILQHRKTWLFGQCLSTKSTPEIVNFDASGLLGGIIYKGHKPGFYMKEPGSDPDPGLGIPGIVGSISIQKIKFGDIHKPYGDIWGVIMWSIWTKMPHISVQPNTNFRFKYSRRLLEL